MTKSAVAKKATLSHNLLGQRLGRKGLSTRQRILAAAQELLEDPESTISLSAVARKMSISMTAIYLYFADLTELLLALLEPLTELAEASHLAELRERWDDDVLGERCLHFLNAYRAYWKDNSRLLHLRNQLADGGDERMKQHRITSSTPLIALIVEQMNTPGAKPGYSHRAMGAVLVTGIDRVMTVHAVGIAPPPDMPSSYADDVLRAQARLLEMAIRDGRSEQRSASA